MSHIAFVNQNQYPVFEQIADGFDDNTEYKYHFAAACAGTKVSKTLPRVVESIWDCTPEELRLLYPEQSQQVQLAYGIAQGHEPDFPGDTEMYESRRDAALVDLSWYDREDQVADAWRAFEYIRAGGIEASLANPDNRALIYDDDDPYPTERYWGRRETPVAPLEMPSDWRQTSKPPTNRGAHFTPRDTTNWRRDYSKRGHNERDDKHPRPYNQKGRRGSKQQLTAVCHGMIDPYGC